MLVILGGFVLSANRSWLVVSAAVLVGVGCGSPLKIPEAAQIKCLSNADCASGFVCITTTGLCAVAANVDHTPPTLEGTVTPSPTLARDGTTIEVQFTANKPLAVDPVVTARLGGGSGGADAGTEGIATFVKVSVTDKTYVYRWIAHSGDPEGTATISIDMVDRVGNPGSASGGSFVLDFTPPGVIADSTNLSLEQASAGETQTVSFVTTEAVAAVTVRVGTNPAVEATHSGNQYSFTYVIPSDAVEGATTIVAHLEDQVGNNADVTLGSFIVDRTAPTFTGTGELSGGPLRAGDDIRVRLDFTEPVGDGTTPLGVRLVSGSTTLDMLRGAGSSGISSHWEFLHTVRPGEDGTWTATVHDATDVAGNAMSSTTLTGSITVDTTAPSANSPVVPSAPLKNGDTLTVSFTASEVLTSDPVVSIAGKALTRDTSSAAPAYVYKRTVNSANESEGGAPVLVEMADSAGNRGSATLGTVLYDFTSPGVVSGSPALTLTAPSGALVGSVSAVTTGTGAVVTFTANEVLSSAPVVTATSGSTTLTFTVTGHPTTAYVATLNALPGSPAQGQYAVSAHLVDLAGNAVDLPLTLAPVKLVVDTAAPAGLTTAAQSLVVYSRNPWGSASTNGVPTFQLTGQTGAIEAGTTLIAYDSADVATRTELGRLTTPSNGGGAFGPFTLQRSDHEVVYLVSVDSAGNASPAADVKNVTWTATLNDKVVGDTIGNPNTIFSVSAPAIPRPGIDPLHESNLEAKAAAVDGVSAIGAVGWSQPSAVNWLVPPARERAAMAYDAGRQKVVLFGGVDDIGESLSDTWEWDGRQWSNRVPAHAPPARRGHAMVYDAAHARTVLFGGEPDSLNSRYDDTWVWNGVDWKKLTTNTPPEARENHAMIYDPKSATIILFGGTINPYVNGNERGDTWELNGATWTKLDPDHVPPARQGAGFAWDAARSVGVLFGGLASGDFVAADIWEWNGSDWNQTVATGTWPSKRSALAFAFDAKRGTEVVFGGYISTTTQDNETWEWNGSVWAKRTPATSPSVRARSATAYDPSRGEWVLLGGYDHATTNALPDTWEWNGTDWTRRTAPATPPAWYLHSMAYDTARGRVMMTGDITSPAQWDWDGTTWIEAFADAGMGLRWYPAFMYDSNQLNPILFGGTQKFTVNGASHIEPVNDTWALYDTTWEDITLNQPPAIKSAQAFAYDQSRTEGLLVIGPEHGGEVQTWYFDGTNFHQRSPAHVPSASTWCPLFDGNFCSAGRLSYDALRDVTVYVTDDGTNLVVWEWNGSDWLSTDPTTKPPLRAWETLAYDPARGRTVMFGGMDKNGAAISDLWEWDGANWSERPEVLTPAARSQAQMVNDAGRSRITMFGGYSDVPGSCETVGLKPCSDTWRLNTPDEQGVVMVQLDARRAAQPTLADPAERTVNSIKVRTVAGGSSATSVRGATVTHEGASEAIPDNDPTGLTQRVYQPRSCTLSKVELGINIRHSYARNLLVTLASPDGTTVRLYDHNGTAFNQQVNFPTQFSPRDSFDVFNGKEGAGYWTLKLVDDEATDTGDLNGWMLTVGCAEPTIVNGANVYAWNPQGAPWDSLGTLTATSPTQYIDRTATYEREGTSIDGWNDAGWYRFAVTPRSSAGSSNGSVALDYFEATLSYTRQ